MAANKDEVAALRKNLAQAKQKTMNFAFCPGKKGDDCLLLDPRKPTEALVREARKISTGTKTAGGTLTASGSTINLVTESDLPNVSRILKKYLKSVSISMKVQLVDAEGVVLEADEDDQETDAEAAPTQEAAEPAEQTEGARAADSPDPKLQAALSKRLKQVMTQGAAVGPEVKSQFRTRAQEIAQQIKSGALPEAARSLISLENLVQSATQDAAASTDTETEASTGTSPPPLAPAQQSWRNARTAVKNDLKSLVSAVATATSGAPQLKSAARQTAKLNRHFDPLDGRLELVLERLDKATSDPERDKLIKAAHALINEHRRLLDSPFFKAVDNNGFVATRIRGTMLDSLQQVNSALTA
jgi:hypothetical protein